MKHIKTTVLALLCAFAGMTNIALAADKTVTYTFSADRDNYTNRWTLTFTPSSTGFGYSTGTKTATIQDLYNTTGFSVQLDDGLQLSYSRSAGRMTFVGDNSFTLNWQGDENTYFTLTSSHYYVKHVKLATANGDALPGQAAPWTVSNTQMDTDVDMVTQTDGLKSYSAFSAHITAALTFAQLTVTYGEAPRPYAITFNEVEGLSNPNPATYSVTTPNFLITAPSRTGYDLSSTTYTDGLHPNATAVNLNMTPLAISRGDAVQRKAITFNTTWTAHTYTLRLHHNDGTDAYTDMAMTYDEAQNIQTVSRTGCIFDGWSTTPDGSIAYTDGQEVLNLTAEDGATIDLYAQWTYSWAYVNTLLATDGAVVTLPGDITAGDGDSYLLVPRDVTATLDLNGHTINRNLTSYGGGEGSAIRVEGSLTINDSQGGGCITGGDGFDGGGVYVSRNASFTMNGGTISGNTARNNGGGVMVYFDATCTLNGVTISGNTAFNSGGGVYVNYSNSCSMTDVTITGNTASYDGGGVCAGGGTTFSGLCTITGNTVGGQNNNVFRVSELYIGGTLDPATRIGINVNRVYDQQQVITYGLNGKGSLDNFFCDVEGDQLSLNDDGEAVMTLPPVKVGIYSWSANLADFRVTDAEGNDCENDGSFYYALSGTTVYVHVTPRDGYGISNVTYGDSWNPTPATFVSAEQREFVYTFVVPYTTDDLQVNANTFGLRGNLDINDNEDNRPTIANYHGRSVNPAYLGDRTLYRDGDWNTLCLPFNVSDLSGTCLEGATLMELGNSSGCNTGFDATTGTLTLDFVPASSIEAGHAYLVKWETTGDPIEDPLFDNVTVVDENPENQKVVSQDGSVTFVGSYCPVTLTGGDRSVLYLGSNNNLYFPAADRTMGAFRAYFRLNLNAASEVKAFVLNFNEDDATSLNEELRMKNAEGVASGTRERSGNEKSAAAREWYTLDGRKLNGKPTKGGIYIHNGRKEVLK